MVLVYTMLTVIVLMAATSLAVDWGRVETAKTELQNATDAAVRYAVSGISDGTYSTKAIAAAANNNVDGVPLTLLASDIDIGYWDTSARTFTANGTPQNAIRVSGHRTAARGTGIPLLFAKAIGRNTCDINTTSIASMDGMPYALISLGTVNMSGTTMVQRKAGEDSSSDGVIVAGNTNWSMTTNNVIAGDQFYVGSQPNQGTITGSRLAMTTALACAIPTTPTGLSSITLTGNSGTLTNQSGTYTCGSINLSGTYSLSMNGDLTVYCSGAVTLGGNININTNGYKLTIYVTGSNNTNITANYDITGLIVYAPNSNLTINVNGILTGSFVGKTIHFNGGTVQYSSAYPVPITPTGGGGTGISSATVLMVK